MKVAVKRKPREEMTRDMLKQHIEALVTCDDTMKAALESHVSYPTFLARFRRLGLKITEVRERVLTKKEQPDAIVEQVFSKIERKRKPRGNVVRFRSRKEFLNIAHILEDVAHKLERAANAAA